MTIPAERLREDQTVLVRGKISFSRLAAQITGADLERSIAQAKRRGSLYPTLKPHTTVSLVDARVTPIDAANLTVEEQYVAEKIYTVKSGDNAGKNGFSHDDTSPTLPTIFAPGEDGKHHQEVLGSDLDSGLDVTLVLRTFKAGEYEKRGLNLAQVILHEPIRYYQPSGGADSAALAALGITIDGPVRRVQASEAAAVANSQPIPEDSVPEGSVISEEGFALPGPVAEAPQPAAVPEPAAVPAAAQDDKAEMIARLQAQLAAAKAAKGPQGASPFDVQGDAGDDSPWDAGNPGIAFGN